LKDGLDPDQVEDAVSKVLTDLDDEVTGIEFVLNVQCIAETVQPETDQLLKGL
jgi:hypothetical protein